MYVTFLLYLNEGIGVSQFSSHSVSENLKVINTVSDMAEYTDPEVPYNSNNVA
jgi:hypothetical protein